MLEQQERLWDYEAVEPGQQGQPTLVTLTADNIGEYALAAQNPDPRYREAGASLEFGGRLAAMPTMAITYAPLLRDNIAENCGFVALERSKQSRRQTPFAKCEVRWFAPALEGDTVTGIRRVLEKYERRGSRFVTFRVEASNQRGERLAEYDYTCIFDYAKGQREVPATPGTNAGATPGAAPPGPPERAAATPLVEGSSTANPLLSPLLSYDRVAIGDQLADLQITESAEVIIRKDRLRLAGGPNPSNIHTDEEFARQNIFGGAVNSGPATMSYVDQMLQRSFPLHAFYGGGSLLMRAITPFRAGDTVTFAGEVTGVREEAGQKMVECRVEGTNQRGELVSLSDATLVLAAG
jgi:acyl dehydratase